MNAGKAGIPGGGPAVATAAGSVFPSASGKERYLFIDLFRTIIILLMLEGHVLRQFLPDSLKNTTIFGLHEILHGITAPAFLFGAGLTFVISSHKRWTAYHRWGDELERRMRRIVMIFLLGIFLHLPYLSIRKIVLESTTRDLLVLFQSDVLTCISVGLLTLHILLFCFRSEARFQISVIALMIMTVYLTPLVWEIDFLHYTPLLLAQLSNSLHGSPFPLFPFAAYLFAGVAVSGRFLAAVGEGKVPRFMLRLTLLGLVTALGGFFSALIPVGLYRTSDFWYTSPSYFFIRLGFLLMATAAVWWLGRSFRAGWTPVLCLGKESLLVYVLHLIVLYGSVINAGTNLRVFLPETLGPVAAGAVFAALTVAMLGVSMFWNRLKTGWTTLYRVTQAGIACAVLFVFFTRDF